MVLPLFPSCISGRMLLPFQVLGSQGWSCSIFLQVLRASRNSNLVTYLIKLILIDIKAMVIATFLGFATMLSVVVIQIPELRLGYIADILNQIFLIFPNYALGMGIVQLSTNFQLAKQCHYYNVEFLCPVFPDSFCCAKRKRRNAM